MTELAIAGHVRCVATTIAKPGHEEDIRAALEALIEPTSRELGFLRYELHQALDERRRFIILEEWTDRSAFDAHCVAAHIQRYAEMADDWIEHAEFHPMAPVLNNPDL